MDIGHRHYLSFDAGHTAEPDRAAAVEARPRAYGAFGGAGVTAARKPTLLLRRSGR